MKPDRYKLTAGLEFLSYEFTSVGPKGMIKKHIQFLPVNDGQFYNLAFGDVDPVTGEIDDLAVSNNGDRDKILATIVDAVYSFLNIYPGAWIYASGSTDARTRLYKIAITRYFNEISEDFLIYGQVDDDWHSFEKDKKYIAFIARLKSSYI